MTAKLEAKGLYKVFGDSPKKALKMVEEGLDKDEIFAKTGQTIGVKDASFSVNEGEIFVIMGLSGSGKSTLVRLLNRLIEPSAGEVLIDGENITSMKSKALRETRRKKISMVFQSFALMPHMTVIENTMFGLTLDGVDKAIAQEKAQEALEQVGLGVHTDSFPSELSGGMQQRVGLARALATGSEIMLMDEAFSALDPLIRTEMQDELIRLQADFKRTIIFISHDLDEAMRIGDRIAIMQGGEILQIGTPEDILNNPANDYVASFFKGVSVGGVMTAQNLMKTNILTVYSKGSLGLKTLKQLLDDSDFVYAYVHTANKELLGVVSVESVKTAIAQGGALEDAYLEGVETIDCDSEINSFISTVADSPCPAPVVNEKKQLLGVITRTKLLKTLDPN